MEHLDYHKNFKNYLNAKLYLFKKLLDLKGNIIFDETINQSKQLDIITKKRRLKKYTFGSSRSFINKIKIQKVNNQNQIDFTLNKKNYSFKTSLLGKIQIKNLMFAIIAAYLSNLKINKILKSIQKSNQLTEIRKYWYLKK